MKSSQPQNCLLSNLNKRFSEEWSLDTTYGVETRVLNQAVRRNIKRFPDDFMFQLSKEETELWKSQIVMTNKERMGLRRRPYAFTQEGIAMLSGVLNSERAIHVNIGIMRAFVKFRQMLSSICATTSIS